MRVCRFVDQPDEAFLDCSMIMRFLIKAHNEKHFPRKKQKKGRRRIKIIIKIKSCIWKILTLKMKCTEK